MTYFANGFYTGELKPNLTVGGCIDIYENVWPNPQETIERIEDECANPDSGAFWTKASTFTGGQHQNYRSNINLLVSENAMLYNNPLLQNVHNQFYMALMAASIPYAERYKLAENLYHEGYNLLKYKEGTEYKAHYDSTTTIGRVISAICYLNNDFSGGEIEFPNFNLKIKPEPGMLILFPSAFPYLHIAHPVTKGTKYALVTWLKDRPNQ